MAAIRTCAEPGCPNPAVHGAWCWSCQRERPTHAMDSIEYGDPWDDEPTTCTRGALT